MIVGVVQQRLGSTRLPEKAIKMIDGVPMTVHQLRRMKDCRLLDRVVLAVPKEPNWELELEMAIESRCEFFLYEKDPADLIGRHYEVARHFFGDVIVRVPGDNPCVCPKLVDKTIEIHLENEMPDCMTTTLEKHSGGPNTLSGGLGCEVYGYGMLARMDQSVWHRLLREHPHLWPYALGNYVRPQFPEYWSQFRFDVNTAAELEFIQEIYRRCPAQFTGLDAIEAAKEIYGTR